MFNWIKDNPIFFFIIFLAIAAPSLFLGAVKVVFYIVLAVILFLVILGIIFRAKITRLQNEMRDSMSGNPMGGAQGSSRGFYNSSSSSSTTEQGDVKIFKQRGVGEKRVSGDVGDYVEFEEVDQK